MTDKLLMAFRRIIREEIRTELSMFKREFLSEISKPSAKQERIQNPISEVVRPPQKTNTPRKSLLQTILEDTDPMDDEGLDFLEEQPIPKPVQRRVVEQPRIPQSAINPRQVKQPIPIVTEDIDGRPVNLQNPKVREVLDIMNMDFGSKLKAMEEHAKRARGH